MEENSGGGDYLVFFLKRKGITWCFEMNQQLDFESKDPEQNTVCESFCLQLYLERTALQEASE